MVSSSSRCSGVSATSGRLRKTTSPGSLPAKRSRPVPASGIVPAVSPAASPSGSGAKTAGTSPPGIYRANTIGPPTAARIAASPAPPTNPRREIPVRRPNANASARSGSSASSSPTSRSLLPSWFPVAATPIGPPVRSRPRPIAVLDHMREARTLPERGLHLSSHGGTVGHTHD